MSEDRISELEDKIAQLEEDLEDYRNQCRNERDKRDYTECELSDLRNEIADKDQIIDNLRARISILEDDLNFTRTENSK